MEAKIKPQDLRLGSLLNFEGQPMEVAQINPDNTIRFWREKETGTTCGCFDITKTPIERIPLNDYWFGKLGFEKSIRYFFKSDNQSIQFISQKDGYYLLIDGHKYTKILFVDQLQNLFYWLSGGSELTINDKVK